MEAELNLKEDVSFVNNSNEPLMEESTDKVCSTEVSSTFVVAQENSNAQACHTSCSESNLNRGVSVIENNCMSNRMNSSSKKSVLGSVLNGTAEVNEHTHLEECAQKNVYLEECTLGDNNVKECTLGDNSVKECTLGDNSVKEECTLSDNIFKGSNFTSSEIITLNENDVNYEERINVYESNIQDQEQNFNYDIEYSFKQIPYQITGSWKEFNSTTRNNYTRGCKWAPDGSCILTCSDDNTLRIFNLPHQLWDSSQWPEIGEMEAVVKISEGELIYDFCWYPFMNSADASTCCLASTSKNSTVHLWDGFTGELRCSYRTFNHLDEIVTPHSLSFDADGQRLFCGFEKMIRIFNVDAPGRNFEERRVFAKKSGQSGIISCFAFSSSNKNISAAGSYEKTIGLYSEPSGCLECLLEVVTGGITQLQFSPDGTLLYSGGRKDPDILCWDLRNLGSVLYSLRRSCVTNQRMYFDISRCGKYIVSGNHSGVISFWDTTKEPKLVNEDNFPVMEPIQYFMAHDDCVNGISLHPTFPLLCSSSGQRKFPTLLSEDEDYIFSNQIHCDNSLRLWWLGKCN